jgi:hypothetical protein
MTGVFASSRKVLNAGSFHSVAGGSMIILHLASFGFGLGLGTASGMIGMFLVLCLQSIAP